MSAKIGLVTLNASYKHTAFGLRYLKENIGEFFDLTEIIEFTIHKNPEEIVSQLLEKDFKIIGFGVYIWNTKETEVIIDLLRARSPDICIVLGGPEVSYETEIQSICKKANHVICGEADFSFYQFCKNFFSQNPQQQPHIIRAELPLITKIKMPYNLYSENDIQNRSIYVEASRGCPYKCEYCLSSLDKSVRNFDIDLFLQEIKSLIDRGARQFKFIDRTFNLSPTISNKILNFFLQHIELGLFLHFEMVPDRLPEELRHLISQFPAGSLQFEIGIQTFNPQVAKLVSRNNDLQKVAENFHFLSINTKVHTHADLIAGLPGENLQSFAAGFDRLLELKPDEIQLGLLKRLKGTPIIRHDLLFQMKYNTSPPFQIISTKDMTADEIVKMAHTARYWDLLGNSGRFNSTLNEIKNELQRTNRSFFFWLWGLSDFIYPIWHRSHAIPMIEFFKALLDYTAQSTPLDKIHLTNLLRDDYTKSGAIEIPRFLNIDGDTKNSKSKNKIETLSLPKRQRQHLQNSKT
jgi:hypothetical protein